MPRLSPVLRSGVAIVGREATSSHRNERHKPIRDAKSRLVIAKMHGFICTCGAHPKAHSNSLLAALGLRCPAIGLRGW